MSHHKLFIDIRVILLIINFKAIHMQKRQPINFTYKQQQLGLFAKKQLKRDIIPPYFYQFNLEQPWNPYSSPSQRPINMRQITAHNLEETPFIPLAATYLPQKSNQLKQLSVQQVQFKPPNCMNPGFVNNEKLPDVIPEQNLTYNNKPRTLFKHLLAIPVTQPFQRQLDDAVSLIEGLISTHNYYFFQKLHTFIEQCRLFCFIKEGLTEQSIQNSQITKNYIQLYEEHYLNQRNTQICFLPTSFQSPIIKFWKDIHQKFQREIRQNPITEQMICEKIHESLKRVKLYFTPAYVKKAINVQTNEKILRESLYHISSNYLTLQKFRDGPLRPYLVLAIFDEIAHDLLKNLKIVHKLQNNEHPLQLNDNNIGTRILKIIKKEAHLINPILERNKILGDKRQLYQYNTNYLDQLMSELQTFLMMEKYEKLLGELRENFQDIHKIRNMLHSIDLVHEFKPKTQLKSQTWTSLLQQVIKDDITDQGITQLVSQKKEQQYKFVCALIAIAQTLKLRSVPFNNQLYKQARYKIIHKNPLQKYYKGIILEFQQVIIQFSSLYKHLKQEGLFDAFTDFSLTQHPIQRLNYQMVLINSKFDQDDLKDYNSNFVDLNFVMKDINMANAYLKLGFPTQYIKKFKKVTLVQLTYSKAMKIFKYYEMIKISCSVPSFIFDFRRCKDSGYFFQRLLFPKLDTSHHIYTKDFELMKNIDQENSQLIGAIPQSQAQRDSSIRVLRAGQGEERHDYVDLAELICGVHKFGYHAFPEDDDWYKEIKQIEQQRVIIQTKDGKLVYVSKFQLKANKNLTQK